MNSLISNSREYLPKNNGIQYKYEKQHIVDLHDYMLFFYLQTAITNNNPKPTGAI